MTVRRWGATVVFLAALLSAPPSATALERDLLTQANLRIDGAAASDCSGFSVSGAGDVNGDGRDDVIIGATCADNNGRNDSGSSYVIYGAATQTTLDLTSLDAPRRASASTAPPPTTTSGARCPAPATSTATAATTSSSAPPLPTTTAATTPGRRT